MWKTAVNKLENVEKASVNLLTETMDVTYDETKITSAEIIDAVVKAGYGASVMTEGSVAGAGGQSTSGNAGSTGKSTADGKQELQQKLDADARAMKCEFIFNERFELMIDEVTMLRDLATCVLIEHHLTVNDLIQWLVFLRSKKNCCYAVLASAA